MSVLLRTSTVFLSFDIRCSIFDIPLVLLLQWFVRLLRWISVYFFPLLGFDRHFLDVLLGSPVNFIWLFAIQILVRRVSFVLLVSIRHMISLNNWQQYHATVEVDVEGGLEFRIQRFKVQKRTRMPGVIDLNHRYWLLRFPRLDIKKALVSPSLAF